MERRMIAAVRGEQGPEDKARCRVVGGLLTKRARMGSARFGPNPEAAPPPFVIAQRTSPRPCQGRLFMWRRVCSGSRGTTIRTIPGTDAPSRGPLSQQPLGWHAAPFGAHRHASNAHPRSTVNEQAFTDLRPRPATPTTSDLG